MKKYSRAELGAFMDHEDTPVASAPEGPLSGVTLGVKDLYDVKGYPTGCGQPTMLEDSDIKTSNAPMVQALLDAGAVFAGKTITDELAFSLNGQNAHYGTPLNPAAPDCIPGGSSSGSASAVAGMAVDFALGTDTGGSVRAPASYCGLYGLRPGHGVISLAGVMALAPSCDTAGWFARDAALYQRIGEVLIPKGNPAPPAKPEALIVADAFREMPDGPRATLEAMLPRLEEVLSGFNQVTVAPEGLDHWVGVFRTVQCHEIWQVHGRWIEARKPAFGPGVKQRFEWSATVTDEMAADAAGERAGIAAGLRALTAGNTLLVMPTVPGTAPPLATPISAANDFSARAPKLLCMSVLSGLPQMTMPLASHDGAPLGLSLMGPEGSEHLLMELAVALSGLKPA